jgi:CheY-like chemotaxis protein
VNLNIPDKTILIVDDDSVTVYLFKELIEPTGAKIISAQNGKSTMQIISKQKVDLILLDLKLKDCSGYNLLKEIRQVNPNILVVAQTAYAMIEDYQKCIEAGFDDYLSKPIKSEDLYAKLTKHLAS